MGNNGSNKIVDEKVAKIEKLQDEMRQIQFDIKVEQRTYDRLKERQSNNSEDTQEMLVILNRIKLLEEKLDRTRKRVNSTEAQVELIDQKLDMKEDIEENKKTQELLYRIERNEYGRAYRVKKGEEEEYLKHSKFWLLFSLASKTERIYGKGIRLYFQFGIFISICNLLIFLTQLLPIIWEFIGIANRDELLTLEIFSIFSPSKYKSEVVWPWRIANGAVMILVYLFPFMYLLFDWVIDKKQSKEVEESLKIEDKIVKNMKIRWFVKWPLRILSAIIFLTLLTVELIFIFGFSVLKNFTFIRGLYKIREEGLYDYLKELANVGIDTGYSTTVSILISITNSIFKFICVYLTKMELYNTYTAFTNSFTLKLITFKILNMFLMSTVKGFFCQDCILDVLGKQYLTQIVLDIVVNNLTETLVPLIKYEYKEWKMRKNGKVKVNSLEGQLILYRGLGDFDIGVEYLEYIYRQLTIYLAVPSSPWLSFIAIFSSLLEIILDKFKMVYFCKKPPKMHNRMKYILFFLLLAIAIFSQISWAGGSLYQISGVYWCNEIPTGVNQTVEGCEPCAIFGGNTIHYNLFDGKF